MAGRTKKQSQAAKANNLRKEIADRILALLEQGVRPWVACYSVSRSGFATRVTGEQYKGINRLLLTLSMWEEGYQHPVWMTFNQAQQLGGNVKGQKASLSVFYGETELDEIDPKTQQNKIIKYAKPNRVFNVEQISGLSDEFKAKFSLDVEKRDISPIDQAETFIKAIPAKIITADAVPCYRPADDLVSMPEITQFKTAEHYYATALHELVHWTMHKTRLNRPLVKEWNKENYHREELTAEIGASFLLPELGIEPLIDEEHAPYIADYIKLLKDDPQAFLTACSQAEKAADYLKAYQVTDPLPKAA